MMMDSCSALSTFLKQDNVDHDTAYGREVDRPREHLDQPLDHRNTTFPSFRLILPLATAILGFIMGHYLQDLAITQSTLISASTVLL